MEGSVQVTKADQVATVEFAHPKANSLPSNLLQQLAGKIGECSRDDGVRVIVLKSAGEKAFCAGASFDELLALTDVEAATEYFMGFARVVLAIRDAKQFVVTRVQGKAVGGAVGLIAAADYSLAGEAASLKLSELSLGFGPFVISLPVIRKVGVGAFSEMSIDTEWRDAHWGRERGLFAKVSKDFASLEEELSSLTHGLTAHSLTAMEKIKQVAWAGTENWEELFLERARFTAELALSQEAQEKLSSFTKGK